MIVVLSLWIAVIGTVLGFLLYMGTSFYPFLALGIVLEIAFGIGYLDRRLRELSNTFSCVSGGDKSESQVKEQTKAET